jgi:predicted metal-dependent enzyme (double-stranded beta helix superfamily)
MFDPDRFIEDCRAALAADPTHRTVREVVERAVADPAAVARGLGGGPTLAGSQCLYRSPDLTILNLAWGPYMTLRPHNHRIWAVIGIYGGAEDNIFWRRIETEDGPRIEAAGAKSMRERDACAMGAEIIHSVTNPTPRLTAALHVYGGDFYRDDRSEWDAQNLVEKPFDFETSKRLFAESNARLRAA